MNKVEKFIVVLLAGALVTTNLTGCSKKGKSNPVAAQNSSSPAGKTDTSNWSKANEARSALDSQEYDSVINLAKKRLSEKPNDASAYFLLGQAQMGKGDYQEARKSLENAITISPDNQNYTNIYCRCIATLASEAANQNRLSEAITLYKKLLAKKYELAKTEAALSEIYVASAEKLAAAGNKEDAETILNEGTSLVTNDTDLQTALAKLYISDDRLMEAERLLKKLTNKNPNNADTMATYASLLQKMGDNNEATLIANKALSLDSNNALALSVINSLDNSSPVIVVSPTANINLSLEAMNERIKYLENLGNYTEEKQLLEACLQRYPEQTGAYYKLAQVCEKLGLIDEACTAIEKYNSVTTNSPEGQFLQAKCYSQKGRCDDALNILSNIESVYGNKNELLNERGQIMARKGDFNSATSIWNSVLASNPNDCDASFYLGQLSYEMGKTEEATKYFEKALSIQPTNNKFKYFAGVNYIQTGHKDLAASLWSAGKENLNPNEPYAARILRAMGEDPELQAAAMRAAAQQVSSSDAQAEVITIGEVVPDYVVNEMPPADYEQALEYARTGRYQEAEQMFRQVILNDPTNFNAMMNLGKVYTITNRHNIAAAIYLKALKLDSRNLHALRGVASSYSEVGMHGLAAQISEQVKANYPDQLSTFPTYANPKVKNDPRAIEPMSTALLQEGLNNEALAIIQGAISETTDNDNLYLLQGDAYKQMGMFDLALESYKHVQDSDDQQNPTSFIRIGDLYVAASQSSQAISEYRKALNTPFIDPDSMFYISDRMSQLGHQSDARAILNKLRTMNLNMEQIKKLDQRLGTNIAETTANNK